MMVTVNLGDILHNGVYRTKIRKQKTSGCMSLGYQQWWNT